MTTTVALPPVCGASGARAFRCRNARKISQATAASQAHESTICMLSPALAFRVPERGIGGCYVCRFADSGLADFLAISPREWLLSGRAVSAVIVLARVRMIAVQWPSSPILLGLPRLLG